MDGKAFYGIFESPPAPGLLLMTIASQGSAWMRTFPADERSKPFAAIAYLNRKSLLDGVVKSRLIRR